jgi:hypothetical protein
MELREALEKVRDRFTALITPPFALLEIFDLLAALGEIVKTVAPAGTEAEYKVLLIEAFAWTDEKFNIVESLDNEIKFPVWLTPAEAFDGTAIRYLITSVLIPELARRLSRQVG